MIEGRYAKTIKPLYLTGDLLCLTLSYVLAFIFRFYKTARVFDADEIILLSVSIIAWIFISIHYHLYLVSRLERIEKLLIPLFKGFLMHFCLLLVFIFLYKYSAVSRLQIFIFYAFLISSILTWRLLFLLMLKNYRKAGNNFSNVVIIGAGHWGKELRDFLTNEKSFGFKFIGYFDDDPLLSANKDQVLGTISDIPDFIKNNKIDEIYCALPDYAVGKIKNLIKIAENNFIRFYIIPDFRKFINKRVTVEFFDDIPIISLRNEPLERFSNRVLKRMFDIVFSFLTILLVFPWLLPLMAIFIKLDTTGPIFFKQLRNGKNNKEFYCFKFRSMRMNAEADTLQAQKGDRRITKLGKFLRKYNIDEIPQFLNVLKGDMSLVGPRPHMLKHTVEYTHLIDHYLVRQMVKPGITGWAQVNGFRGETREPQQMRKRVRCDAWYIENWSLLLDLKILAMTVWNMLKGEENAG
jgi:putative colanic acid biosysnthesis UDP-glucose lipid carrier transferase